MPVIAPLGITEDGQLLNINADTVAGDIAQALSGSSISCLLTDVPGVQDKDGDVLPSLTAAKARQLIRNGTISGGMIPKVTACLDALEGVPSAHIVDGREPHAVPAPATYRRPSRHPIPRTGPVFLARTTMVTGCPKAIAHVGAMAFLAAFCCRLDLLPPFPPVDLLSAFPPVAQVCNLRPLSPGVSRVAA